MPEKPKEATQMKIRIEEELRVRLQASASKRGVALNKEITERLLRSYQGEDKDIEPIREPLRGLIHAGTQLRSG